jgi:hypothetical protein
MGQLQLPLPCEEKDPVSENSCENGFNQDSEDSSLTSATELKTVSDEIVVKSQADTDCKEALNFTRNNIYNQSKKSKSKDKTFELSFTKNKRKTTFFDQNVMDLCHSDSLSLSTSSLSDIQCDKKDELNYCTESVDINLDFNFHSIYLKADHLSPSKKYGLL